MKTMSTQELKAKLDRSDNFKLVMTMGEWAFNAKHIPGSFFIESSEALDGQISPDDEIVVTCSSQDCMASAYAFHVLESKGFANISHYDGGLMAWEAAGYPLEGEMVK